MRRMKIASIVGCKVMNERGVGREKRGNGKDEREWGEENMDEVWEGGGCDWGWVEKEGRWIEGKEDEDRCLWNGMIRGGKV